MFVKLKNSAQLIREYVLYHRGRIIDGYLQNDATTESFIYNTIKPKSENNNNSFIHSLYQKVRKDDIFCCRRYLSIKEISDVLAPQTASPYVLPVGFTVSIPLNDLFIFSAISAYTNSLLGDLKIKFKINPQAFIYCQIDPVISLAKFYSIYKDELLSSGQDKLKDVGIFFHNQSFTYQYTNIYIQIGCTADLITGIRAEELTPSGLKNLVCDIKPVTVSVRNYIISAVTANMSSYEPQNTFPNSVCQFYQNHLFVIPAQRIESWAFPSGAVLIGLRISQNIPLSHITDMNIIFPKDPRQTTYFEYPSYQNMQVSILGRNFPDFPINTLNKQFFIMQFAANNLDNIYETTDEYQDSLATPRGNSAGRYNSVSDYTSFFITTQCERNSNGALTFDGLDTQNKNTSIELRGQLIYQGAVDTYYNIDTNGKHLLPPIKCTVHDIFWLFTPFNRGSCDYDTIHSFDVIIGLVII
ncbi:MAG: hypothetical protein EZS28_010242 [Streblomastix strix]|uniref:Uncharacterized protein n=1 Tax=Streblomastix strix TaxID=222440 RepID=A0A5J4WHQ8_9EUKA|nr:MAG: hypothetical protein EZS28_010242 [Streblomastix strix]